MKLTNTRIKISSKELVSLTVGFCIEKSLHTNDNVNKGNQNKQKSKKKQEHLLNDMNVVINFKRSSAASVNVH